MKIGDTIRFVPNFQIYQNNGKRKNSERPKAIIGNVVGIHLKHRFFRVRYQNGSYAIDHECFKF